MDNQEQINQKDVFPLQWRWDVSTSKMICSEPLPKMLGYPGKQTITLNELMSSASSQMEELEALVRHIYKEHTQKEVRVLIDRGEHRFVGSLSIKNTEELPHLIQGSLDLLTYLPSREVEYILLHQLLIDAQIGMLILDQQRRILKANKEYCRATGFALSDILGEQADLFRSEDDRADLCETVWSEAKEKGVWSGELLARDNQGLSYAHELILQRVHIHSSGGEFFIAISKRLDVSVNPWLDEDEKPTVSASSLPLAGKLKRYMEKTFTSLPSDKTMVVFVFQPSFSKDLSKSMQYWLIGNRMLNMPEDMVVGILSTDLFAGCVVVPRNLGIIHHKLQTFVEKLTKHDNQHMESDIDTQATIGVSILGTDATSVSQMITHASQSMVASRQKGKTTVTYFDHRLQKKMDHKQILSRLLNKAIEQNNIQVFYQPIIELQSLKIVKFEALFRVKLDTSLTYDTQELIHLAEENGWIDRIDGAVTSKALSDLAVLQKHFKSPELQISVNRSMSNDRVSHSCLEDTLRLILDARIDPSLVTVELTESSFLADFDRQMSWIEKLTKEGIEIAIDDFGTGYSSFSYLLNLPATHIKIDRSFVKDLMLGSNAYMMIEMVTSLVHRMGGRVVAEGVENIEELWALSHAKVDFVQGFLFSKPVGLEQILANKVPRTFLQYQTTLVSEKADMARDIMLREFPRIGMDHKVELAQRQMQSRNTDFLVVIEKSHCCGVIREKDIQSAMSPYLGTNAEQARDRNLLQRRVHQIMPKGGYDEVGSNCEISVIKQLFQAKGNTIVIVTGDSGVCLGVITAKMLFNVL
ncbi:MAG: hypothetical protein CENE_03575 [Candidatus Celerinatantimonas neptuna]|nr:MAG: hypothetical protein CENE_03575 [Candidatus Celerinatantimonas neptuna]